MKDLGLLTLRLTVGGLLAGHGAQKLFGSFGGYGLEGTAGWLESMGLKPGKQWAALAGLSELGGGVLTALGLAHPFGPISAIAAMSTAALTAHRGKPIWVTAGGAELPVTNIGAASALILTGPGRLSLDRLLGIRIPVALALLVAAGAAAGVALAVSQASPPAAADDEAEPATQGGEPTMADETSEPSAAESPVMSPREPVPTA
jgi:putative oxidoreductase